MASSGGRAALDSIISAGSITADQFRALGGAPVLRDCADDSTLLSQSLADTLGPTMGRGGFTGGWVGDVGQAFVPETFAPRPTYAHAARIIARRFSVTFS